MDILLDVLEWIHRDNKDTEDIRVLTFYEKYLSFFGLWHVDESHQHWLGYLYPRCVLTYGVAAAIFTIYKLCFHTTDMETFTGQVFYLFAGVMAVVKVTTYLYQPRALKQLCQEVERLHEIQLGICEPRVKLLRRQSNLLTKFVVVYLTFSLTSMLVFLAAAVFVDTLMKRKTIFKGWYPCNTQTSPCLEIIVFHEVVSVTTFMNMMGMADVFLQDLLLQTWFGFKILHLNLLTMGNQRFPTQSESSQLMRNREKKPNNTLKFKIKSLIMKKLVGKCSRAQVHSDSKQNEELEEICDNMETSEQSAENYHQDCAVATDDVTGGGREGVAPTSSMERLVLNVEDHSRKAASMRMIQLAKCRQMETRFTECIEQHNALLRLTESIRNVFNFFLISQIVTNIIVMANLVLYITLIPLRDVKQDTMVMATLMLLVELFVFIWCADHIKDENENVKDAVFGCDWIEASDSFKRSMRIIISRSNSPVEIRAGNFVPLTMETMMIVTKTAYSYFMALSTVAGKEST